MSADLPELPPTPDDQANVCIYRAWALFIEELAEPDEEAAPARARLRSLFVATARTLTRKLSIAVVGARRPMHFFLALDLPDRLASPETLSRPTHT
jgi:hypothetical protein